MFKNSALQVKLVKTPIVATADEMDGAFEMCSFEMFNSIAKDHAKRIAVLTVASYAAIKVVNTACTIAINYAPKK